MTRIRAELIPRAQEGMLSPDEVGACVLDAVRADEPWVITHPAWRPRVAERSDALIAAFDRAAARGGDGVA